MEITEALEFMRLLESYDIDVGHSNSYLEHQYFVNDGRIETEQMANELDITQNLAREILRRYSEFDAATPIDTGSYPDSYRIEYNELRRVTDRLNWLAGNKEVDGPDTLLQQSNNIRFLYTFPEGNEEKFRSNLTGAFVDLIADSDEEVIIISPFFDEEGVEIILNAMANATGRAVTLSLLSRDILTGDESNKEIIQQMRDKIQDTGLLTHFKLYEFDRDAVPNGTLHAKAVITDQLRAYIGSANITNNSLRKSFETGVLVEGDAVSDFRESIDDFLNSDFVLQVPLDELE